MMKRAASLFFLFILICNAALHSQERRGAQRQGRETPVVGDSTIVSASDSVAATPDDDAWRGRNNLMQAATDSMGVAITSDAFFAPSTLFKPTPRKAVIYSAVFPGMGQVYNRKYWKLPLLYGGFVGLTYAITWNNGYYRDYLGGYQDIMDDNPDTNRWHNLLPYGQKAETVDMEWFTDVLQQRKDYYRYYRDLSIIGTVALYMIAMVDAYVDAQLFDFDMSTDLSMRVDPVIMREKQYGFNMNSSSYGLQLSFNF